MGAAVLMFMKGFAGKWRGLFLVGKAFDKEKGCGNHIFAGVSVGMERE